jgi:hypothetical protein
MADGGGLPAGTPDRAALVAGYKRILRDCIDRRPSGLRGRLARVLGKHKSFVSQITSPGYAVPIPAGDVPIILEVCHLAPDERHAFLAAYTAAHPQRAAGSAGGPSAPHRIQIDLPAFDDAALASEVEVAIRDTARHIIRLALHRSRGPSSGPAARQRPGRAHREREAAP